MNAGENLNQRGLAGTIFADDPQDLPSLHPEIYIAQHANARKNLKEPLRFQQEVIHERSAFQLNSQEAIHQIVIEKLTLQRFSVKHQLFRMMSFDHGFPFGS